MERNENGYSSYNFAGDGARGTGSSCGCRRERDDADRDGGRMNGGFGGKGGQMPGNQQGGQRFGDRSYAIASDHYVNFSSRVGYHYAILDSWCGETLSKNYIRFEFAGGAAGSVQRERRVRCIGVILTELGFTVEIVGDRIRARYQKYPRLDVLSRLDQLGRLLIMTRQMDMLMTSDAAVHGYAMKFLNGEYH